ncbi:hypothetical protein PLESTM_000445900 [Pleodorina starrii]|nr:hypothetical protein PLESTM_000445900 [Pleodorina starrii]
MIALYDVEAAKVVSTLCGHTGMVNCVLWVPHEATPELPPSQHLLLSGAADNTICCWLITYPEPHSHSGRQEPSTAAPSWLRLSVLQGHSAPVTSLAVHRLPPQSDGPTPGRSHPADTDTAAPAGPQLLLVSTAGDTDVIVWACGAGSCGSGEEGTGQPAASGNGDFPLPQGDDGAPAGELGGPSASASGPAESDAASASDGPSASSSSSGPYCQAQWRLDQRIPVGTRMQTTAAMTGLPLDPDWTLLATGGTDRKVALHVRPPGAGPCARFTPACVLEGHENWVRGVAFCCVEGPAGPQLLLASVSQDRYGRIWKLQPEPLDADVAVAAAAAAAGDDAPPAPAAESPLAALIQRYAPKPHVATRKTRYVASCEALLIGHEDWVHGLQWTPPPPSSPGGRHSRATAALLTASMDRTMVIWRSEASSGLWMNEASLGDAGASCLGYFGGVWGPGGAAILAHGFTGALHLWRQPHPPPASAAPAALLGPWLPRHALGGHFGAVVDLGWGVDGGCLISVSEDQTARLHTAVRWHPGSNQTEEGQEGQELSSAGDRQGPPAAEAEGEGAGGEQQQQQWQQEELHWCEVARAQIHGHDFRCVAPVASPAGSHYMYVSGSEEKVLRVLEAPQAFIDTLVALRGGEDSAEGRAIRAEGRRGHGFGAAVAALGLSNKAVDEGQAAEGAAAAGGNAGVGSGMSGGDYTDGPDFVPCAAPQVVSEPPLEEHLAQNTLWPETHKLYGHGNDVFCTAASPDGRYLASACKAQTASTASIWVWCTRSWRAVAQLRAHSLTVTQLEWSPSSSHLAAVSRDRTFSIFRRSDPQPTTAPASQQQQQPQVVEGQSGQSGPIDASFELVCRVKSAHGRVIWSVSWSLDEQLLATASRDDTVKVWRTGGGEPHGGGGGADDAGSNGAATMAPALAATLPQFPCAATAVAFAPRKPTDTSGTGSGSSSASGTALGDDRSYVLAVGLEDGSVQIWRLAAAAAEGGGGAGALVASCLWSAGEAWRHAAAVRRLRWRAAPGTATAVSEGEAAAAVAAGEGGALQLASGSEDHSVRVFKLRGC